MAGWYAVHRMRASTKVVVAAGLFALLLVAAVPVALLVGVVLMLLGHVVGGLALFGASILAAVAAVVVASLSGVRHLRRLVAQRFAAQRDYRVVQLGRSEYHYD